MKKIENIASIEGRVLLREIFKELRYDKQRGTLASLLITWRIATNETEISKYVHRDVAIIHSLGFFRGASLWLEEIVNRFYFSTINSFVYFGAAILLVLIGVRRFSDNVSDDIVIWGIIFEAMMLFFMFFIMLFTPSDEFDESNDDSTEEKNELITEIGEISRDFAAAVVQLEQIGDKISLISDRQAELIDVVSKLAEASANIASPNPEMISKMAETNRQLDNFKSSIASLSSAIDSINSEQVKLAVRSELESIISGRLKSNA